jgi:cytochrome c
VSLVDPGHSVKLYVVFDNPAWTPTSPDLLSLDWLRFNGEGLTAPGTSTGITASASVTAPLTYAFSSVVSPPSGRTITGYSWDFGDNSAAVSGASASHKYARKGTYTARLTTTDSAGAHSSGTVVVTVS